MDKREFRRLAEQRVIMLDGATGTELVKLGMQIGRAHV